MAFRIYTSLFQGDLWNPLPYLVMGLMGWIEVVLFLALIPETKGKPLPDRMPDDDDDGEGKALENIRLDKVENEEKMPLKTDK